LATRSGLRQLTVLGLAASLLAAAGCAVVEQKSADTKRGLAARVTHPVRYRVAGADPALRANLDRALDELAAGNYRLALPLLNRALWDIARIRKRDLRLTETVTVYESLQQAFVAMGMTDLADEARRMAKALGEAAGREPATGATQLLARAKDAYAAAQFREAVRRLRQVLIDLEDIADVETRVTYLAETRCYLAFAYFATQDRSHVQVELRRLGAFDPAFAVCGQDAPPGVRALIAELRRNKDL
jgi:tetratricopeptide (TPR) repeat protein